jgi:hypothetical protein
MAMTDIERREALLESVERHEAELGQALDEFKEAVRRPFQVADHVRDHIGARPLPWLLSSMLIGVWLGSQGNGNSHP